MSLLDLLEPQPAFPREDLSEVNAAYLSLAIANLRLLERGHRCAEEAYPIFNGTHRPLAIASGNIFGSNDSALHSINFGIKALEALTLFVQAERPVPDIQILKQNIDNILKPSTSEALKGISKERKKNFAVIRPVLLKSSPKGHPATI